jgi:hypothetical protein
VDAALTRLGMPIPDTAPTRRACELITEVAPPVLVNHSVRCYAWAVELARHDRLRFDAEILYVSAMLHDLGLIPEYDLGGCYDVDGAIAAQQLAREAGAAHERVQTIYDAIVLPNDAEPPPDAAPEVVLIWDATGVDVTGERFADVRTVVAGAVLAAYSRIEFKREFSSRFADQVSRKPDCPAAALAAGGILAEIAEAPFET